jgi:predicted dehydrogenase
MSRIKVGQIGIGHNHASEKMATFRKLADLYEVVGVVEPDPAWRKKRGGLAAYAGLKWMTEEELLGVEGLSVVAVETDVCDLVATAARCIAAGHHLHLDKPGGETLAPFKRLMEEAWRKGLTVQMGYMFRNNPAAQFCLRAVREGWLGRVFEIHAVMSRMDGADYRKWLSQFHGGAMYIFGCHLIDLIAAMMGRPERVVPFQRRTWTHMDRLYDNGLAVLEYPNATATVRTSVVEVDGFKRRQLVVCGDEGTIEIKPIEPPALRLTLSRDRGQFKAGRQDVALPPMSGRYDDQIRELARIVRGEIGNPYSLEHELIVQEATLRAAGYSL